ncbi:Endothiapepsin [Cytospora mali]|uniref:Endothiapepsin n=1 Tax=Cytospora mali TaxID=578113 RepID=A0A194WE11_CYTMA|nr:Endothiapepsin [Valsa mali]
MQTFGAYLVALLAASTELAAALPQRMDVVQARNGGGTLSVPVRRNTANSKKHPAMALAKVYTKYGKEMPTRLRTIVDRHRASVAAKRSTSEGSVTNTPEEYDTEYLANIQIGTPAQTLPMDFDTGSSDLWVFSGETAASSVNGQTLYYPSKSSTAQKKSGYTWQISYGDGSSSSGDVYMDTVTIGNLTVSSQAVEAATTVSSEFTSDSSMSGLVGLAFSSINTVSPKAQNTFFANAMPSLDQPVFTADLKHDADGSYNFGYIDSSAYTGDIYYADLYNVSASYSGYWTFQSTGYAVGSGSTSSSTSTEKRSVALTSTTITGIADTGTTLLMLPDEVVTAYYSQVSGAEDSESEGGYVFSCDQTLPDFTFAVGDGQITVPGDYINWSPVDETNTTCYGGLQSDSDIGLSIFGDIALKAALVVFDGGNLRLGWAAKTTS